MDNENNEAVMQMCEGETMDIIGVALTVQYF